MHSDFQANTWVLWLGYWLRNVEKKKKGQVLLYFLSVMVHYGICVNSLSVYYQFPQNGNWNLEMYVENNNEIEFWLHAARK